MAKEKVNYCLIIGIAYVSFLVGTAYNSVGQSYEEGVYGWYLPIIILVITLIPFALGFYSKE